MKYLIIWLALGLIGMLDYIKSQIKHKWQWDISDIIFCLMMLASGFFSFLDTIIPNRITKIVIKKGNSIEGFDDYLDSLKVDNNGTG